MGQRKLGPTRETGALLFSVGKEVQVSFDSDDRRDAWFPATILEDCGNGSFLVEYRCPVPDNDEGAVEKVTVDSFHIRPCPPNLGSNKFNLLEKVDVFYDFGWWSGVITRELADSRYIIFFKQKNKEKELSDFELRPHMDWKDGQWFPTSQDVPIPSDCKTNGSSKGSDTSILQKDVPHGRSGTMNEISDGRVRIKDLNETPSTDEISAEEARQSAHSNYDAASSQPRELPEERTEAPNTSLELCKLSAKPFESPRTKSSFDYPSQNSEFAEMKTPVPVARDEQPDNHSWKKRTRKRSQEPGEEKDRSLEKLRSTKSRTRGLESDKVEFTNLRTKKLILVDDEPLEPIGDQKQIDAAKDGTQRKTSQELGEEKSGSLQKLRGPRSRTRGSKGIAIENAADVSRKPSTRNETSIPIILGLEYNKVTSPRTKRFRQIDAESLEPIGDQKQSDAAIGGILETKELGDGESSRKKKRGRPSKRLISTLADMEPSGDHPKDECSVHVELPVMGNEDGKEQLEVQMRHNGKSGKIRKMVLTRTTNEKALQSSSQQHEKHFIRRGKPQQPISAIIESQAQGSVDPSGVKTTESNRVANDGEEALAEVDYNRFDDQPLAKWFEEMQAPTSVDGSRVSPAHSPKQCAEVTEKLHMPPQTPVNRTPTTQTETQNLPFVKNTLLWATIESMDIFQRNPQKPHFRPLEQCKESSREGLAIGFMVTFSSIVERTSRLHYDEPRSTIEEILETLSDLENHGFDVQLVRGRLTEFLSMKDKQEMLEAQVSNIDNEIIKHTTDRKNIDGEIEEIEKQIAELQDKLSLAISRKEVKDREIDALRSALEGIQADMKNAHKEFEGFASKPL